MPLSALDELIEKYRRQHPAAPTPGNPFADLIPRYGPLPSAQTPGAARALSPLDALMAEHKAANRDQPTTGVTVAPQSGGISPDNPFADLVAQPQPSGGGELRQLLQGMTQTPAPTSGVTIAPKGGAPREATSAEAAQIGPDATWADVAGQAGENLLPSAQRFGTDIWDAVTDPRQTARSLKNVVFGTAEKLVPGEQSHEKYANAVGQFFANRYGGMDAFKKTLAEDPVGFAADLATVLSGGELAAARVPGVIGEVGRAVGTVGRAVDPVNAALKTAGAVGKGVGYAASVPMGLLTGKGGQSIRAAGQTGAVAGDTGADFRAAMRGNVTNDSLLADTQSALGNIKQARQAAYQAGMADLSKDQTVLDFGKIDDALKRTEPVKEFKGVSLEPSASATARELAGVLDQWRNLDPAEYHTPVGFDALKQRIGDVVDQAKPGSASQKIATQVYNIVRDQIVQQAPGYAKTMQGYQQASDLIREMNKTLSLNPNASIDTKLGKLRSVMSGNYGNRADLAQLLEQNGAKNLMAKLAGQSLSSFEPRGLARAVAGLGTVATGAAGLMTLNPAVALPLVGQLALQSPRLVGEVVHAGGRVANAPARNALLTGYQTRGVPNALAPGYGQ